MVYDESFWNSISLIYMYVICESGIKSLVEDLFADLFECEF